jgi:hypothetical protein
MDQFIHNLWSLFVGLGWWSINRVTLKLDNLDKRADEIQHTSVHRKEFKQDIGNLHTRINSLERLAGELKGKAESGKK